VRTPAARPLRLVGLAAAAALLSASCVGIPERSAARVAGLAPGDARPPDRPGLSPVGDVKPERGDSQRDIVSKYLQTQADPERGHGAARQFLTQQAAESWNDGDVRVIDSLYVRSPSSDNSVAVFSQHQVGRVTSSGSFTPEPGAYSYNFRLTKVDGEWRIVNPPSGVIVSSSDFENVYRQYVLYYLDPAEKQVIPDLRYFPSTSTSSTASRANLFVRLLLQAPSPALGVAVRSELGGGVGLAANVVEDDDKVLNVYLTGLGTKSASSRSAAAAQIVWTLSQLATSGIRIFDDGQLLDLPELSQPTQQSDWQSFDPDALPVSTVAYFLRGGAVYTMDGNRVPGPAGAGDYALSSLAVSLTSDASPTPRLAGVRLRHGQAELYVGELTGNLSVRLKARTLTAPTWDSASDEVWTVRDGKGVVRVPRRGQPATVDVRELDTLGTLRALRLSRDGTRAAVIAGHTAHLYIARVSRDNGQVALEQPIDITPSLAEVYDVAWATATKLTVVARDEADRVLMTVSVDGARATSETKSGLSAPPSAVAAAPNLAPVVASSDDSLWQRSGDRWTNLVRGSTVTGRAPVYPD
jgi:Lipoprotein LpqB beta-propeller domain/Sporulation and spore germination